MSAVPVVAIIRAKSGKESVLESLLKNLVKATHEEPGCALYALHRSAADPQAFVFVEKWKSQKDLESHLGSPHIAQAMARKEELIESIQILPLEVLPAGKSLMESF